ncbi:MAG: peptidylprolyl isomerase [Phycisphaerales bacterium]|jgi:parvulin-like peptidyl-prolyl isomerase|nr:peptidylprolyl isomerase [Phycisphaerales bacterium]
MTSHPSRTCARPRPPVRRPAAVLRQATPLALAWLIAGGCASQAPEPSRRDPAPRAAGAAQASEAPPPLLAGGRAIEWAELSPRLAEAAGPGAIRDLAVLRAARSRLSLRGERITQGDLDREERDLKSLVARSATGDAPTEEAMLAMRQSRGLGPVRYRDTLELSASLRRLISPIARPSSEEVRRAFDVSFGTRYRVRLIVLPSEREANDARDRARRAGLVAGEVGTPEQREALRAMFASQAFSRSTDRSSRAAGLVEPISPLDTSYPSALTRALPALTPDEPSPILALDEGFAVLLLEEVIPPAPRDFDAEKDAIEHEIVLRRERVAMEALAQELLRAAPMTPIDPSVAWSLDR